MSRKWMDAETLPIRDDHYSFLSIDVLLRTDDGEYEGFYNYRSGCYHAMVNGSYRKMKPGAVLEWSPLHKEDQ